MHPQARKHRKLIQLNDEFGKAFLLQIHFRSEAIPWLLTGGRWAFSFSSCSVHLTGFAKATACRSPAGLIAGGHPPFESSYPMQSESETAAVCVFEWCFASLYWAVVQLGNGVN